MNQYKINNFSGKYIDAEIHTHDIFKSRDDFTNLDLKTKYQLLNNLYSMIEQLDLTIISIIIDKELLKKQYPTWTVFKTAWTYLVERYSKYLECNDISNDGGIIKIDKSTNNKLMHLKL